MNPNQIIYPNGKRKITVSAAESIAVQTSDSCQVFQSVTSPNVPGYNSLLGTVNNTETVFGPFASGATIILEAGAAEVAYETGTDPVILSDRTAQTQGAPGVLNTTGSLTATMMLAGIVTSTTAAAVAGTVPTGAVLDAAVESMKIGQSFDWSVITTGANAFTVTAASGHTLVGNMVVAAGKAGMFRTRKTAVATYVTYSIANT